MKRKKTNQFLLILILSIWCYSPSTAKMQNLPLTAEATWTGTSGVSISGNTITSTISGWGNARATSIESIDYGTTGSAEFSTSHAVTQKRFGFSKINTNGSISHIDFAISVSADGRLRVWEHGDYKKYGPVSTPGMRITIERKDGVIRYLWNGGSVFYTSTEVYNGPLFVTVAMETQGDALNNIKVSDSFATNDLTIYADQNAPGVTQNLEWTNLVGIGFKDSRIIKTAPTAWGNAGASSVKSLDYLTEGWVEASVTTSNTERRIGLSRTDIDAGPDNIHYAISIGVDGYLRIYEHGVFIYRRSTPFALTETTVKVERKGHNIIYSTNLGQFYTSAENSHGPLVVDIALSDQDAILDNVDISASFAENDLTVYSGQNGTGVAQNVTWTNIEGVGFKDTKIIKTNTTPEWGNAGAASIETLNNNTDGWVEITVAQLGAKRRFGLSETNQDAHASSIDFAIDLEIDGRIRVHEKGVQKHWNSDLVSIDDRLRVTRTGGQIQYLLNGNPIYTSTETSSSELIVDIALHTHDAILNNLKVSGTFQIPGSGGSLWFPNGNSIFYLDQVTIGTNIPLTDHLLSVNGKIAAKGVKVTLDGWADYVFEKEYELMSLSEVKKFIEENGHLPEIPNTEKVIKEGIYLGEMNKKLLQKIEELTLHLIHQNERIEQLEKEAHKKENQ